MRHAFIDTSRLLALTLSDDAYHERALAWNKALRTPLVTTEYVLIEYADGLAKAQLRDRAIRGIAALRINRLVTVISASTELLDRGLELYSERKDKDWELTDRISFRVMGELAITDALTSDRHFEQAGFRALLRMPVEQA